MTDFTRDALIEAVASAMYLTDIEQHISKPAWSDLSSAHKLYYQQQAHVGLNAILANARIVPPTVTDEMVGAANQFDVIEMKIPAAAIDAAISAGKLK